MKIEEATPSQPVKVERGIYNGYIVARSENGCDYIIIVEHKSGDLDWYYVGYDWECEPTEVNFSFEEALSHVKEAVKNKNMLWTLLSSNEELKSDSDRYPHICPHCGAPSFNNIRTIDCSSNCC